MYDIKSMSVDYNDVIIITYDINYDVNTTSQLIKYIQQSFPNNRVIFLPNNFVSSITIINQ